MAFPRCFFTFWWGGVWQAIPQSLLHPHQYARRRTPFCMNNWIFVSKVNEHSNNCREPLVTAPYSLLMLRWTVQCSMGWSVFNMRTYVSNTFSPASQKICYGGYFFPFFPVSTIVSLKVSSTAAWRTHLSYGTSLHSPLSVESSSTAPLLSARRR